VRSQGNQRKLALARGSPPWRKVRPGMCPGNSHLPGALRQFAPAVIRSEPILEVVKGEPFIPTGHVPLGGGEHQMAGPADRLVKSWMPPRPARMVTLQRQAVAPADGAIAATPTTPLSDVPTVRAEDQTAEDRQRRGPGVWTAGAAGVGARSPACLMLHGASLPSCLTRTGARSPRAPARSGHPTRPESCLRSESCSAGR
jgi:hypothetical protein